MSVRLIGQDWGAGPQNFVKTKVPMQPNPWTTLPGQAPVSQMWSTGGRPSMQTGLGTPTQYARNLKAYQALMPMFSQAINKEVGVNYTNYNPNYGANSLNEINKVPGSLFARAPIGTGEFVSIPAARASYNGQLVTPGELTKSLSNAQLVKGGFGPLQGLMMLALAAGGFPGMIGGQSLFGNLIGKLPQGLQNLIKIGGGANKIAELIQSKGKSGGGMFVDLLGAGYKPV